MAAEYEHNGYRITRNPIPMTVDGRETTGWGFDVRCPEGKPVDIVVEAVDRRKGLHETRRAIDRYIKALTVAEPALVAALSQQGVAS